MKTTSSLSISALTMIAISFAVTPVRANEYADALGGLAVELQRFASDPVVVAAVQAQNVEHSSLDASSINEMDQNWRGEVGLASAPLIEAVLTNDASKRLTEIRDASEGQFTEIFAMDNHGLNVAASDVTSDYWQGDEAKWQKTYLVGADAVHISEVELDESTQTYQSQVSVVIVDPGTSEPIGAITFGVDVESLE